MEWRTYTPEGRPLFVRRQGETWVAQCGAGEEARNDLLDVALIEAIHRDHDVAGHALGVEYGSWTREQADSIERDYLRHNSRPVRRPLGERRPQK